MYALFYRFAMGDEAAGCFSCCAEAEGKDCIEAIAAGAIFTPDDRQRQLATWQSKLAASFFIINFILTLVDAVFGAISIHDTFKSVNEGVEFSTTTRSYYTTGIYWPTTRYTWPPFPSRTTTKISTFSTGFPTFTNPILNTTVSPPTSPGPSSIPSIPATSPSSVTTMSIFQSTSQTTTGPLSSLATGGITSATPATSGARRRFKRYNSDNSYQQSGGSNYYWRNSGNNDGDLSGLNIWLGFYIIFCVIYLPFETLMLIYMLFGFRSLVYRCRQYQKRRKAAKESKNGDLEEKKETGSIDEENNEESSPNASAGKESDRLPNKQSAGEPSTGDGNDGGKEESDEREENSLVAECHEDRVSQSSLPPPPSSHHNHPREPDSPRAGQSVDKDTLTNETEENANKNRIKDKSKKGKKNKSEKKGTKSSTKSQHDPQQLTLMQSPPLQQAAIHNQHPYNGMTHTTDQDQISGPYTHQQNAAAALPRAGMDTTTSPRQSS